MTGRIDRAHCVATAVVQIVADAFKSWLHGKPVNLSDTHHAVARYLRDEFSDIERAAIGQFRHSELDSYPN
jgi:hypothetical protein